LVYIMGTFEEAKGRIKEAAGDVTGNPDLRREGEAQADRGKAEREATEARAEARAHEAKAEMDEREQRIAERSK
jgi:uncharacterized protein YjbJ (UPF0337 family)